MELKTDLKRDRYETIYNNMGHKGPEEYIVRVCDKLGPEYYEFYNEKSALEFISIVSKRNELGLYDMLTFHDFYFDLDCLRNQIVDEFSTKTIRCKYGIKN